MEILRIVNCRVMKGLGPEWIDKNVTVFLDDIGEWLSESEINDMVIFDAKEQLRKAGFIRFNILEITNA